MKYGTTEKDSSGEDGGGLEDVSEVLSITPKVVFMCSLDISGVVGWGRGAVDSSMGAGEREEVAMLDDRTGFSALNEDDVGIGDEA